MQLKNQDGLILSMRPLILWRSWRVKRLNPLSMLFLILLERFEGYLLGFLLLFFLQSQIQLACSLQELSHFHFLMLLLKKKKKKRRRKINTHKKIPLSLRHTQDSENAFLSSVHHNGIWIRPEATVKCIYFLPLLE